MSFPFSHEPSWFAALIYISGKDFGFIMRDDFEPMEEKGAYAYSDTALERVEDLPSFIQKLSALVEDNGHLMISALPAQALAAKQCVSGDFNLLEESLVAGRWFFCWQRSKTPQQGGIPEVMIWRNGGGIGDVYHAVAVAEEYDRQGFNTCFMAMDKIHHIFAANPHIRRFVPIPTLPDQVLYRFMDFWARRVRLFINLDWSVEGFLLKKEITSEYHWSDNQRRAMCGKSYARNVADMAGLPEVATIRHYASEADKNEAGRIVGEWE